MSETETRTSQKLFLAALSQLFVVALLTGCAGVHHSGVQTVPAIGTARTSLHGGFNSQQQEMGEKSCLQGIPEKTSEEIGPTEYIFRQGYVLEHSSVEKVAIWVCESVDATQLNGTLERSDKFVTDPELKGPKSTPTDYAKSGYDRGHMAPAGNQTLDQKLKDETFYMSNMAPQLPGLNRNAWKSLEEKTRGWVNQYGHAWEWTGPLFYDPKEDKKETASGTVSFKTIGPNAVAVPPYFYKIIVVKNGTGWKSIAFALPNEKLSPPYQLEKYIVSIQWIEQHTGLNFMPKLPSAQRQTLKTTVSEMWP